MKVLFRTVGTVKDAGGLKKESGVFRQENSIVLSHKPRINRFYSPSMER